MYIWTGEVEEAWDYDDDSLDNIRGEVKLAAEDFDAAQKKLLSLFRIGEKLENEDRQKGEPKFWKRTDVQIIRLERGDWIDA